MGLVSATGSHQLEERRTWPPSNTYIWFLTAHCRTMGNIYKDHLICSLPQWRRCTGTHVARPPCQVCVPDGPSYIHFTGNGSFVKRPPTMAQWIEHTLRKKRRRAKPIFDPRTPVSASCPVPWPLLRSPPRSATRPPSQPGAGPCVSGGGPPGDAAPQACFGISRPGWVVGLGPLLMRVVRGHA